MRKHDVYRQILILLNCQVCIHFAKILVLNSEVVQRPKGSAHQRMSTHNLPFTSCTTCENINDTTNPILHSELNRQQVSMKAALQGPLTTSSGYPSSRLEGAEPPLIRPQDIAKFALCCPCEGVEKRKFCFDMMVLIVPKVKYFYYDS